MNEILKRYLPYNSHAASYTWKYFGNNLDMTKTLEANGVTDEGEDFFELRMDEDEFLPPIISLYFNDDHSIAAICISLSLYSVSQYNYNCC